MSEWDDFILNLEEVARDEEAGITDIPVDDLLRQCAGRMKQLQQKDVDLGHFRQELDDLRVELAEYKLLASELQTELEQERQRKIVIRQGISNGTADWYGSNRYWPPTGSGTITNINTNY